MLVILLPIPELNLFNNLKLVIQDPIKSKRNNTLGIKIRHCVVQVDPMTPIVNRALTTSGQSLRIYLITTSERVIFELRVSQYLHKTHRA